MGLLNIEDETGDVCSELIFYVNGKKVSEGVWLSDNENIFLLIIPNAWRIMGK